MRTLHAGLRVADRERSIAFYKALGYEMVGSVPETAIGHLTMLKLPGDEFVSIELVDEPGLTEIDPGTSLSHIAVQVDSMSAILARLADHGIAVEDPRSPDGSPDFLTAKLCDPDGRQIELVQWPPAHAAGLSAADFPA